MDETIQVLQEYGVEALIEKRVNGEVLKEDQLIILGAAVAFAAVKMIYGIMELLSFLNAIRAASKPKRDLMVKLNKILEKSRRVEYEVYLYKDRGPNAFNAGGKTMYISSGLLKTFSEKEALAILLHEVYHYENRHVIKGLLYQFPKDMASLAIAIGAVVATAVPPIGFLAYLMAGFLLQIPFNITFGRVFENNADNYAVQHGYGEHLHSAFKKLEKGYNKEVGQLSPIGRAINKIFEAIDEHPPLKQRMERIIAKKEIYEATVKKSKEKVKSFLMKSFQIDKIAGGIKKLQDILTSKKKAQNG